MTDRPVRNIAHSVRQRLMNEARRTGRLFNEIEQYYAMERFLYRLSVSKHRDKFVLKGALLFTVWCGNSFRPTRDIDLLGRLGNARDGIAQAFRDVCAQEVPDDGLAFDPSSVRTLAISEDADYEGVRVTVNGRLGRSRIRIQVDMGFSDVVVPRAIKVDYPAILDFPRARLKAYSAESVIAEKLQAMVSLGEGNSRMKDFADLWFLAQNFDFRGDSLARAIQRTFERRKTSVQARPIALDPRFAKVRGMQARWRAFVGRARPAAVPTDLTDVVEVLSSLLEPILAHLAMGETLPKRWRAPGPWRW